MDGHGFNHQYRKEERERERERERFETHLSVLSLI
jgi:hypothetical protein